LDFKKREIREAIILSPRQADLLILLLELTGNKASEETQFFPECIQDIGRDIEMIKVMKIKAADIAAGKPRAVSQFEGIILVTLLMGFRLIHYDTEKLAPEIEEIGRLLDDFINEAGYLPFFYLVKEDKLA
jgi:hypothetical protein